MAFFNVSFHSDVLGKACGMNVIVPRKVRSQTGMVSGGGKDKYPVLYLLQGLSDDHTIWSRRASIERHAASKNLGCFDYTYEEAPGGHSWEFRDAKIEKFLNELPLQK